MARLHGNVLRRRFVLRGRVQGVGFRPFVFRLARRLRLVGFVANSAGGAVIEVQAPAARLSEFRRRLLTELPALAQIASLDEFPATPTPDAHFRIAASQIADAPAPSDDKTASANAADVTPDAATCADCLRELFDPRDRHCQYAFINCTNCGPRYSIIARTPYDRPNTSMASFAMCPACRREYEDPADRRFHAQPIACPACGPRLHLLDAAGRTLDCHPLDGAAELLRGGAIVAIKGIGGYHIACLATDEAVVRRLRVRKLREAKPLALMVRDIAAARRLAEISGDDERALRSTAAPIVLCRKRQGAGVARSVAPRSADFGLMLAYAPLHHLLLARVDQPLVMTSANLADEPLLYRDEDALRDLAGVVDAFVVHDREIVRPLDDSVVFTFRGTVILVRRARGYVPEPVAVEFDAHPTRDPSRAPEILAAGAELKSTVCVLRDRRAIVSEHLGDLTTPSVYRRFRDATVRLQELFRVSPARAAHDLHPQILSTQFAQRSGLPCTAVQHHHAHIASVMAEHGESGPVIGVACDGVGLGDDGAVWGGELLRCERGDFVRAGHLEYFALPGGDAAAIDTWRPAAGLLRSALGPGWIAELGARAPRLGRRLNRAAGGMIDVVDRQIARGLNAPQSSSLGRVFDAVAFLLGACFRNRYEAEAASVLEALAREVTQAVPPFEYDLRAAPGEPLVLSLAPSFRGLLDAIVRGEDRRRLAARFHETVARLFAEGAAALARRGAVGTIALGGGCFVNQILLRRICELLEARGLRVIHPRRMPPGDGGLSLGQAYVAAWRARESDGGAALRAAALGTTPLDDRQIALARPHTGGNVPCVSPSRE